MKLSMRPAFAVGGPLPQGVAVRAALSARGAGPVRLATRGRVRMAGSVYDEDPEGTDSRYLSAGKGRQGGDPLAPKGEADDKFVLALDPDGNPIRREKKVTKAAAAQQSMSFQDAWVASGRSQFDVWFVIGLLTILTPIGFLVWGISTGIIPV